MIPGIRSRPAGSRVLQSGDFSLGSFGPAARREASGRSCLHFGRSHRDVEVTGPIQVFLFAASTALDTDFSAKVVDVFPGGLARNLTDGLLRARYRNSLSKPELMTPGEIYKFRIDAGVTSNVFRKGHRIRLEISSSNFPRFDRNQNTGRPIAEEMELKTATQTVHHDHRHASYILLPIIPTAPQQPQTATRASLRTPGKRLR